MPCIVTLAACQLNQWVLDFENNRRRIVESIVLAKAAGARLRVGPELEITGYGCLDHFLENDVYTHSWEMLAMILNDRSCDGILLDIGMPVIHRNCRYNCRIICLDGKILLIRPKLYLANDGNYREIRFFTPWLRVAYVEEYYLPPIVQNLHPSATVPFGDAVVTTRETSIGVEMCEEVFTQRAPHVELSLNGVDIFTNSSGSHHTFGKIDERLGLISDATVRSGGVYIYANLRGGDGDRLYFDGCTMIAVNGEIVAQASQFGTKDVEVITATVDLDHVRGYSFSPSTGFQAASAPKYRRLDSNFSLTSPDCETELLPTLPIKTKKFRLEEEIAYGPGSWLWDFLRRSGMPGFLLPLSGGIDSCATALIVYSMCRLVMDGIKDQDETVISDVRRIAGRGLAADWIPKTANELSNRILHTVYMGMKNQSSAETRERAKKLSESIGSYHVDINIDDVYEAQKSLLSAATGFTPKFAVYGGTKTENLALQNIQSRSRMVTAYYFAQMLPTVRHDGVESGALLVLGSSNVNESLRGYLTKYDCSSADINPIGSITKEELKQFVAWAVHGFSLPILNKFVHATPTAELEPITQSYVQSDEADMGMTYEQLSEFGALRKRNRLGPLSMFVTLRRKWANLMSASEIAQKVKEFYHFYNINRHKATTLTPAYHASYQSTDDNRFDMRPFLYPSFWTGHQFKRIDQELSKPHKIGLENLTKETLNQSNHSQAKKDELVNQDETSEKDEEVVMVTKDGVEAKMID